MKRSLALGLYTLQKTHMLLTAARVMAHLTDERVLVITGNDLFKGDINPYEYGQGVDLLFMEGNLSFERPDPSDWGYGIYDLDDIPADTSLLQVPQSLLLMTDQHVEGIEYLERCLSNQGAIKGAFMCLYRFNDRSKISSNYLLEKFQNLCQVEGLLINDYDEADEAKGIDYGHNGPLRLCKMSRDYRRFIVNMAALLSSRDRSKKALRTDMKSVGRARL